MQLSQSPKAHSPWPLVAVGSSRSLNKAVAFLFCLLLASSSLLQAFPPAPYYTLYGTVRDQVGQTISSEDAVVILLRGGVEIGSTPISPALGTDHNYNLAVRIDHNRSGTTFYSDKAVAAQGLFSVVVKIDGALFYPIEVSGNLTAGKGSERVRLDLTLGEDLDGDGLPDIWEQWQLYQAGLFPDDDGKWPIHLITRDGDFDGDGSSNLLEYIAGTFAGDATSRFALVIKEKLPIELVQPGAEPLPAAVRFEFYGITGKTYSMESSPDLKTWKRINFSVATRGPGSATHTATGVGIVSAFTVPADGTTEEFFRLNVR